MKLTIKKLKILFCIFLILLFIKPTKITCTKSSMLPSDVTTKVLQRATGNLYLGLEATDGPAIVAFKRYQGYGDPIYNQIVPTNNDLINSENIEFLAMATERCDANPLLAVVTEKEGYPKTQTKVFAYSTNFAFNNKSATSGDLKEATNLVTSGIANIAASNDYIFAAVMSNNDTDQFGALGSAIALVKIENNTSNPSDTITISQTDAEAVDASIDEIKIVTDPIITGSSADLFWDEHLERLYIGIEEITTATNINDGARSVIVARVNTTSDTLIFNEIAPDSTFDAGNKTEIVGVKIDDTTAVKIGVYNLKVMHTSTGKSYLIVNGGNEDSGIIPGNQIPGNQIYALPLVDDPDTLDEHGTLAKYTITNNLPFTIPATIPSDLLKSTDPQAQVGTGKLPLEPEESISDIVVIGDAVFISINLEQKLNTEAGIFYSQAMFDEDGRIYRWTPWTKRAYPFYESTNGQISFFDIDAANGKIWTVDGIETYSVAITNWTRRAESATPTSLIGVLNQDFSCGSFSYLDLDQSTIGLGQSAPARYALFGGFEQVAFVRTSISFSNIDPFDISGTNDIPYSQYVTQDFSDPQNYKLTQLPPKSGCTKILTYSRVESSGGDQNYFFAGTQSGLYAFSNPTNGGFTVNPNINFLNSTPFAESSWKKISNITGSIIDMKSSGNALYILTFESTRQKPIKNTLYKVEFEDTTTAMFDITNIKIIAENNRFVTGSDLSNANMFFAIQVITTFDSSDTIEELLLATNNGLYRSNTNSLTNIFNAKNQSEAKWEPVDPNDTSVYTGLFAPDNPKEQDLNFPDVTQAVNTVWPVQTADENNCRTYEKSNIRQLSGSFSTDMPTFDPEDFNSKPVTCLQENNNFNPNNFNTIDPISYFWSDGARRFFIIKKTYNCKWTNKLFVFPYDVEQWNVTDPNTQVLTDPELKQAKAFYWIGPIGATGIVLAGTNTGVVALQ